MDISPSGLNQRFNEEAVTFLKSELESAVEKTVSISEQLKSKLSKAFNRVLPIDSSGWGLHKKLKDLFPGCGGSGSPAGVKLQCMFDLLTSTFILFDITIGKIPDQKYTRNIPSWLKKGDLVLPDLGYFCLSVMKEIIAIGAFFVSRYLHGTILYIKVNGEFQKLDLFKLLREYKTHSLLELNVYMGAEKVPCRLIAVRLPEEQRNEKLRKLKEKAKKRGRTLSKQERFLAPWNIYVTNVNSETLTAIDVAQMYRLRWSVELLFKQFKSTLKMHVWSHGNQFRLKCELLATLIVATIIMSFHGLAQAMLWRTAKKEISFEKLFKLFKNSAYQLFSALTLSLRELQQTFRDLFAQIQKYCKKESRKSRPSSLQALLFHKNVRCTTISLRTLKRFAT